MSDTLTHMDADERAAHSSLSSDGGAATGLPQLRARVLSGELAEVAMLLSLQERERLMIYTAAKLAEERKERGLKLNLPEATALITSFLLEGARDGREKAELQNAGRNVLSRNDVLDGVPEMLSQLHIEATFPDGTKIVAVPEPIP